MRQTACPALNPITVDIHTLLFNCTAVVQASDAMKASSSSGLGLDALSLAWSAVVTSGFLYLWLAGGLVLAMSTLLGSIIVINLILVSSIWRVD